MENCPEGLKFALSEHLEIQPCVRKDIGPFRPLPCSPSTLQLITPSSASGTADHVRSLNEVQTATWTLWKVFWQIFKMGAIWLLLLYGQQPRRGQWPMLSHIGIFLPPTPSSSPSVPPRPPNPTLPNAAKFCQILQNFAKYCQISTNPAIFCQILPNFAKFCQILPNSTLFCQILPISARFGRIWPNLADFGNCWQNLAKFCQIPDPSPISQPQDPNPSLRLNPTFRAQILASRRKSSPGAQNPALSPKPHPKGPIPNH